MNRNEQFLSLIGLCLRGRNLEVGEEPVEAVARARDARVLLLASDAADNTARRVQHFAEAGQCVWLRIPFTKQELGQATGRELRRRGRYYRHRPCSHRGPPPGGDGPGEI